MSNLVFPTSAKLKAIEQIKMPVVTLNDPLFEVMPIVNFDSHLVEWEQGDNYTGLQNLRGLDGRPMRVPRPGVTRFAMQPGVYGEFVEINETELTMRRSMGDFARPIDISELVLQAQEQLLNRRIDRIRQIGWAVLRGQFQVVNGRGLSHTDSYPVTLYTAGVPWSTFATSAPLADFRAIQLLGRGKSCAFNSNAKAFMNRTTFNNMLSNTNNNDLAGRRVNAVTSVLSPVEIAALLANEGLPTITVYDEGYLADGTGAFTPFIPDNTVIVVGYRPSANQFEYLMTRNASNKNMEPGSYTRVLDDEDEVPRRLEVHDGHNGGPAIYFPGDVIMMSV